MREPRLLRAQTWLRYFLVVLYGVAGAVHLLAPDKFMPIMPSFVPAPRLVILLTGLCEIAGAVGLLIPPLRRAAGLGLALYAVCVFPANIKHAVDGLNVPGLPSSVWYHGPRLLLQPVIVWAAVFCADLVRWPFSGAPRNRNSS